MMESIAKEEPIEQDVKHSLEPEKETVIPKPKPSAPIMLKLKQNYREQLKILNDIFPDLNSKISGEYIRLYTNSSDEHRSLTHALAEGNDCEYYVIPPKEMKPIKILIKELPIFTKTDEIISDLEDLAFTVTSCRQLIFKRTKTPLPFFLIILPKK
ncbi:uncharacterized protein TNIN_333321 [Trichonephila inaurata madagascariensis]|uniref:Pre-C2HC domain-containing protein n=1 Tax=Trichonephila inaurata madagascariensis TaxID=2747483 RepID=A0A8X6MLW0_9ARAC|nr:uncharacterized protein TNIN_333321 [Trichonephila inaurata madagascariensis]